MIDLAAKTTFVVVVFIGLATKAYQYVYILERVPCTYPIILYCIRGDNQSTMWLKYLNQTDQQL